MNLLVDARAMDRSHTGIAVFTRGILPCLRGNFARVGILHKTPGPLAYYKDYGYEWVKCQYSLKDGMLGSILETRRILKSGSWDIFFSPLFFPRILLRSAETRVIVMIHDLIYLDEADHWFKHLKLWLATFVGGSRADKILTVSEYSRSVIEKKFPYFKSKLSVVPCPVPLDKLTGADDSILTKLKLSEHGFFLFVSALRKYKGYEETIQAFGELDDPGLKLVIVGKPDLWQGHNLPLEILQLSKSDSVVFTGYISDMELNSLYRNAMALVFPSLAEGFGIPVIEAQHHGCPVICTAIPPLKETAGKGAYFIPDPSKEQIKGAMSKIISSKALRTCLVQQGHINKKRFENVDILSYLYESR